MTRLRFDRPRPPRLRMAPRREGGRCAAFALARAPLIVAFSSWAAYRIIHDILGAFVR